MSWNNLVDLETFGIKNLKLNVKYATQDNFIGKAVYKEPRACLMKPAALALANIAISSELQSKGLSLMVFDGYRPLSVTRTFWELTPENLREFVADPVEGSKHNRGCAVDLTLYHVESGKELEMPCGFDCFDERAHCDYVGGSEVAQQNRDFLRKVMESSGLFKVQYNEWWHFNFTGWEDYPILDIPFENIPTEQ